MYKNTLGTFLMYKRYYNFFISISLFFLTFTTQAFTTEIGKGYCTLTHPVSFTTTNRKTTCESQHIVQQQSGGADTRNTIWISTLEHDYLDRSKDKPWAKERPWTGALVDSNAEKAYMMGTYAKGFHYMVYNHHGSAMPTLIEWDGISHAIYGIGSIANILTKHMSYIGYQIERFNAGQETQFIDAFIRIIIDTVEIYLGFFYSVIGVIVGTILNPLDTLINIPGGILMACETIIEGIANTLSDIISLVTLGFIEL